jgi:hypothetical protein
MAQKDLERLIGRAVLDTEFRARLLADPEKVIREEGFDLTEEELEKVKEVDGEKAKATLEEMAALAGQPWG